MPMPAYSVHIHIQVSPNWRSTKNLVLDIIEKLAENVQIISSIFLSFQIRSESLDRKYFAMFIALSIKSTNIIIFEISPMVPSLGIRKAKFSNPGLRIGLNI